MLIMKCVGAQGRTRMDWCDGDRPCGRRFDWCARGQSAMSSRYSISVFRRPGALTGQKEAIPVTVPSAGAYRSYLS
jgi:hypothetical protein